MLIERVTSADDAKWQNGCESGKKAKPRLTVVRRNLTSKQIFFGSFANGLIAPTVPSLQQRPPNASQEAFCDDG